MSMHNSGKNYCNSDAEANIAERYIRQYKSIQETYQPPCVEMRAEVGLLTRNVKFQGDPATSADNQYGAHIMIHSPGDESCIGRIENVEFFNVG